MKKYFAVSFKYSESVYCSNIAHAENAAEVEKHYSKYEWVSVRECEEHELETARRKGMPFVEIETENKEEENKMTFEHIAAEVTQDAENLKKITAEIIEKGYSETWAEEHRTPSDGALQRHSTETRWNQYKAGTISREKAVELAIKRENKAIDKKTAAKLAQLERVAAAPDLDYISICVEWKRSATWGYNPTATVNTGHERATGAASGCGYDKESSVIASALNQCDSVLKALYSYKESQLATGLSDESSTACTGRDNRNIVGYGAGYAAIPYFEGGVGASCFWDILRKCGFATRGNHSGKYADFYSVEKEVA